MKSSRGKPMIQRSVNGRIEVALNWRELADEAMNAIEPEVRRRWKEYWQETIARATVLLRSDDTESLIYIEELPSSYYSCPPELEAKTIWPSSEPRYRVESIVEARRTH